MKTVFMVIEEQYLYREPVESVLATYDNKDAAEQHIIYSCLTQGERGYNYWVREAPVYKSYLDYCK